MMTASMVESQWQNLDQTRGLISKQSRIPRDREQQGECPVVSTVPASPDLGDFSNADLAPNDIRPSSPKCIPAVPAIPAVPEALVRAASTDTNRALKNTTPSCQRDPTKSSDVPIEGSKIPAEDRNTEARPVRDASTSTAGIEDYYAVSEPVPGSKKKKRVYPKAPVFSDGWSTSEYMDRFEVVKDQLQKTVNEDVKLRDKIKTAILYKLRMVGTTPVDAVPSVVIVWDDAKHIKSLKSLFSSRAQYSLHCGGKKPFSNRFGETQPRHIPPLKLVYVLHARGSINRMALVGIPLKAFFDNHETYCGGLVEYQGSSATLAISIRIDDSSAYLTVDHVFAPHLAPGCKTSACEEISPSVTPCSPIDPNDEPDDLDPLWESDDDEYEYGTEEDSDSDSSDCRTSDIDPAVVFSAEKRRCEDWEVVPLPLDLDPALPYLDWSLARPVSPSLDISQTNLLFLNGLNAKATAVDAIRRKPRRHLAPVKLISGIRGPLLGCILADSSFLVSLPEQRDCELFTVILDTSEGLIQGECGSVVVDQETTEVYGHVVGCDPSGHALVVPLEHVFAQVKASFRASYVGLDSSSLGEMPIPGPLASSATNSGTSKATPSRGFSYDKSQSNLAHEPPEKRHVQLADQLDNQKPGSGHEGSNLASIARMSDIASSLELEGKYEMAAEKYREILEIQKEILGASNPHAVISMDKLGFLLSRVGRHDEALGIYKEAYRQWTQVLGPAHPDTLASLHKIAIVLERQGKYKEAKDILNQAHAVQSRVLDKDHATKLATNDGFSTTLASQSKFDRVKPGGKQAFTPRQESPSRKDPDTLASTNRLMLDLVKQGRYGEAEKMGREILARRQNALGPKHPDTLTSMSNLAVVLKKQERYPEAEQMARRTLELRTGVLGQDHPDTLKSLNNLAVLLACMGEYGKAELMLRETVVLREKLLGKGHSHTGVSNANLASVLELRRRDDGSRDGRYMRVNLEKLQHISVSGVNEQAESL
ncbi:hypothetical protein BKA56DRAFT_616421 [Ilyonectria sp. MPI-CAGE-AT-0026]|nr:hypothetical protein BKA56DRAFT_616421 [Ilyonectria sp. MPI-CAGE-AT-0026]